MKKNSESDEISIRLLRNFQVEVTFLSVSAEKPTYGQLESSYNRTTDWEWLIQDRHVIKSAFALTRRL